MLDQTEPVPMPEGAYPDVVGLGIAEATVN